MYSEVSSLFCLFVYPPGHVLRSQQFVAGGAVEAEQVPVAVQGQEGLGAPDGLHASSTF